MAGVANVVGATADAQNFTTTAANYITQWEYYAVDPSGQHTLLSYEWRSSYGLLYNIYPDKLLNLGIVPRRIYDMQSQWYPTISQVFGVPLDTRHSYTKSDWEMWTAATCSPSTRRLFVNALAYWLNNTIADRPFSDLYETIDDGSFPVSPAIFFVARPVAGGHFSLLALGKSGENSLTGTAMNSTFPSNSTLALPSGGASSGVASSAPSSSPPTSAMSSMSPMSASSAPPVAPIPVPVPAPANSSTSCDTYTTTLPTTMVMGNTMSGLTTITAPTTTTMASSSASSMSSGSMSMSMSLSGSMTTSTVGASSQTQGTGVISTVGGSTSVGASTTV